MTQAKRLQKLDDGGLTPREAVRLWIRDAHEFGSLLDYARWLSGQPDDAYPLVRLPAQVVAGVHARHKGVRDEMFQDELYVAQRDVLFLFHLHAQMNNHLLRCQHRWQLGSCLLSEKLRGLLMRIRETDRQRIERFQIPYDLSRSCGRRKKTKQEQNLDADVAAWISEKRALCAEIGEARQAERVVSRRCFSGDPLLFPRSVDFLDGTLSFLQGLHQVYDATLRSRPPYPNDDLLRWLAGARPEANPQPRSSAAAESHPSPDTTAEALALANHFVEMARAEALAQAGDQDAASSITREWMRRMNAA